MSGLVFGCIVPHGEVIPELAGPNADRTLPTRRAYEEVGRRMAAARPDTLLLITPHGIRIEDSVCVSTCDRVAGSLSENGATVNVDMAVDKDLARTICTGAEAAGVPTAKAIYGASSGPSSCIPLDWGAIVPLWFCGSRWERQPKVIVAVPSRTLSRQQMVEFGRAAAAAARKAGRRLAFIASADWAHAHSADGPYGYHPAAAQFDALVEQAVRKDDLLSLLDVSEELVENAKPDGLWQALMLAGALQDTPLHGEFLSYQCPSYYGMLCAAYAPRT